MARIVGVMLVGLLLKNAMSYVSSVLNIVVQEGLVRDLREALFDHLLRLDLGFFQRTRGGQLIARMTHGRRSDQDGGQRGAGVALPERGGHPDDPRRAGLASPGG